MAAAATQQFRERVSFEINQPVTVTIPYDENGAEQPSRNGDTEYRYFLAGHRIMWASPEVHAQIQACDRNDGATFTITKRKTGRAACTWTVEQHVDEPAAAAIRAAETAPAARPRTPKQQQAAQAPADAYERTPRQGWTYRGEHAAPTPAAQPHGTMYTALCAAIRTAAEAEQFAAQIGRPISFSTGDVRAIANTIYIQDTGGKHQEGGQQ